MQAGWSPWKPTNLLISSSLLILLDVSRTAEAGGWGPGRVRRAEGGDGAVDQEVRETEAREERWDRKGRKGLAGDKEDARRELRKRKRDESMRQKKE